MNIFPLLLAAHLVGDAVVQTDWQAQHKVWDRSTDRREHRALWRTSWKADTQHCLGYHLTQVAFVLPVWRSGWLLAVVALSWATHAFIDRRWPVKALLRSTRSPAWAEQQWGVIFTDQSLHIAVLAIMATVVGDA